eukprot:m51a1_g10254 putative ras gtpase activating (605) ;mRNA; r:81599-86527
MEPRKYSYGALVRKHVIADSSIPDLVRRAMKFHITSSERGVFDVVVKIPAVEGTLLRIDLDELLRRQRKNEKLRTLQVENCQLTLNVDATIHFLDGLLEKKKKHASPRCSSTPALLSLLALSLLLHSAPARAQCWSGKAHEDGTSSVPSLSQSSSPASGWTVAATVPSLRTLVVARLRLPGTAASAPSWSRTLSDAMPAAAPAIRTAAGAHVLALGTVVNASSVPPTLTPAAAALSPDGALLLSRRLLFNETDPWASLASLERDAARGEWVAAGRLDFEPFAAFVAERDLAGPQAAVRPRRALAVRARHRSSRARALDTGAPDGAEATQTVYMFPLRVAWGMSLSPLGAFRTRSGVVVAVTSVTTKLSGGMGDHTTELHSWAYVESEDALLVGGSASTTFPVQFDAVVAKLSASNGTLVWATRFGRQVYSSHESVLSIMPSTTGQGYDALVAWGFHPLSTSVGVVHVSADGTPDCYTGADRSDAMASHKLVPIDLEQRTEDCTIRDVAVNLTAFNVTIEDTPMSDFNNSYACKPLEGKNYTGRAVLVFRGSCQLQTKIDNVADAGATSIIVINGMAVLNVVFPRARLLMCGTAPVAKHTFTRAL